MRNQVHDVRVAFHDHELLDLHGALRGDASDVVASEVDKHDVLRAFLLAVEHVGGELDILLFGFAARAGSCDRADRSGASGEFDELFRGGADESGGVELREYPVAFLQSVERLHGHAVHAAQAETYEIELGCHNRDM